MKIFLVVSLILISACGSNTSTPVIPFIFFNPPGVPQVAGVIPIYEVPLPPSLVADGQADKVNYKPQFVLKYYVTNTEQNFVGYNLSITSATPSLADTQLGASVYAENGIFPSFPHLAIESSTDSSRIQKRKLENRVPSPGVFPFQHCESFTFTLRAVFTNGVLSNPSVPIAACASVYPSKCPVGTPCNSTDCNTATCSETQKNSCFVGTLCNPCKLSEEQQIGGCECPAGVSPPGCNP